MHTVTQTPGVMTQLKQRMRTVFFPANNANVISKKDAYN